MNRFKKYCFASVVSVMFALPTAAFAAGVSTSINLASGFTVLYWAQSAFPTPMRYSYIGVDSFDSPPAPCNTTNRFVVEDHDAVKAILAAHLIGKTVQLVGTGNCSMTGTGEDLHFFRIMD